MNKEKQFQKFSVCKEHEGYTYINITQKKKTNKQSPCLRVAAAITTRSHNELKTK